MKPIKQLYLFGVIALTGGILCAMGYEIKSPGVTTTSQWPETAKLIGIINGTTNATASDFTAAIQAVKTKKNTDPVGFFNNELQCLKQAKSIASGLIIGTASDFPGSQEVLKKFGIDAQNELLSLIISS
ncbi:MAG: hypothetical protein QG632_284 [Candidatus Dependentiae bacterium]|nr:hypothetical protein [Candidatus Dependentiae bacterium]